MGGGSSKRNPHTDIKMNTPSHGNPGSTNALNSELNNVARNTNDTDKARRLVDAGADLSSTNGPTWRHTPLHQAAFHGRYDMAMPLCLRPSSSCACVCAHPAKPKGFRGWA